MAFDTEKELKNLMRRFDTNLKDQNRVNQRIHDEIAKLTKTVQGLDGTTDRRVGDQNRVNQRIHDLIEKNTKNQNNVNLRIRKEIDALAKQIKS